MSQRSFITNGEIPGVLCINVDDPEESAYAMAVNLIKNHAIVIW
ncbi:MAG: hypothetical protein QXQ48_08870 [Nitrososphaerota archaeon]